jgi:triphosphoribosyl-dephospho-CoA synthetase
VSRDAIVDLLTAPSAKLIGVMLLAAGLIFAAGSAVAGINSTGKTVAQHEDRIAASEQQIAELKRLRLIDSFNLYLLCRRDNPDATDCKKPE